ncbi:MAG: Gfo/Idh/MocA family oxidoreductase [Trebonia sp.]
MRQPAAGAAALGAVVVGTTYGVITHARALRLAGLDVIGLVGRDPAKTSARAKQMGIPNPLTDLAAALALPGVSVVVVATPPHTHAEITLAAIAAGKHVMCEKPFALNLAEARNMLSAAERAGVVHLLGTEYRFSATQVAVRRVVSSGVIGQPRLANLVRYLPSLVNPDTALPGWWESADSGGGWLGAAGSHLIDQVRSTLGEFAALSASLDRLSARPSMTADDTYSIHFRLASGCSGVLQGSCAVTGPVTSLTKISGTVGSVWVEPAGRGRAESVWIDTGSGPRQVDDPPDQPSVQPDPPPRYLLPAYAVETGWHTKGGDLAPFTRLYQRLRARVAGQDVPDDPPAATFRDGVAVQAVLDAARQSAGGAGWVEVGAA